MDKCFIQREYGAAIEAHYGLKNVVAASIPTNELDEPLIVHISMLVSKEDIKGIAARFAGEVPAKQNIGEMLEPGSVYLPAAAVRALAAHDPLTLARLGEMGGVFSK